MIRKTLGFGQCDVYGAALTFDLPVGAGIRGAPGSRPFDFIAPGPGGIGRSGQLWYTQQMYTSIFDLQSQWQIGFNIMPFYQVGSNPLWGVDKFIQFASATQNILALEFQSNGKIGVVTGGDGTSGSGTLVGVTSASFPIGSWSGYVELTATGLGGSTRIQMFVDDVLTLDVTTATVGAPDRILLGHQMGPGGQQYFGLTYANLYIGDGQGPAPWNGRLGPIRITTVSPTADAGGNWNISPGTIANRYQAVNDIFPTDRDGSPDGDSSTINPLSLTNDNQWFTFAGAPCFGRILGVNMNVVFRGLTGSTTCNAMLLQQATLTALGTQTVTGNYGTRQYFIGLSPATGIYFTTGEVAGSLWGMSTSSPGLLVSQLFLEEIVSLRNVPYSCGQNSYSF